MEFITGVEAECKVRLVVWLESYDVGWHIASSTGPIGAAVAVAKVIGLLAEETTHAVQLAATTVVGLRKMFGRRLRRFILVGRRRVGCWLL